MVGFQIYMNLSHYTVTDANKIIWLLGLDS